MVRRLPSQPPVLPGFSHLHILGSGGFADVFLYEQNMPRRQVAVKVMLSEVVNDQVRQMFQAEANLMAQLSAHPSILTVYQASVSADGRPYLVMELCSSSLSERYRRERVPVPEVLRVAVKIGSAVETAHRQGVLHRDIKPSNILMTAYGHPVLSDFGIAATLSESQHQDSVGMSIPWSAPEVLMDETPGTVATEVWSLAATVYSLLAGRSPFEIVGGANSSTDLMSRINKGKPQPIDRPDVPASLERVLRRAMSRKPEDRPASVLELVHELQQVESELGVPQTAIEVAMDDWALATVADLEDRTRVRGASAPVAAAGRRRRRRPAAAAGAYSSVGTVLRDEVPGPRSTGTRPAQQTRGMQVLAWSLVASAVLVIGLGAMATWVLIRAGSDEIPVVADIRAERQSGAVEFSWADPGLAEGDSYQVDVAGGTSSVQQGSRYVVDAAPDERVCITVTVNREGRTGRTSGEKCADASG
ncbi:serine/threonine protein kinase [Diaminobutyricimonas aerilata]|uniref:non-specific serine/threonine protein kinase n=1 Tax=Diaminobutyricimonas aerilata TaxID=1162967 RepID=A0A2M9CLF4_9MICO|nr:serine/threonine-protein kinase [Diaminobutyricimonas aerilata]PJJ72709.1 serine/threonine protein kinase [Diaminobutyricimonas aerilata]